MKGQVSKLPVRKVNTVTVSDSLDEPMEKLRNLRSAVSLVAWSGGSEDRHWDSDDVVGLCRLVDDQLKGVLNDLESTLGILGCMD